MSKKDDYPEIYIDAASGEEYVKSTSINMRGYPLVAPQDFISLDLHFVEERGISELDVEQIREDFESKLQKTIELFEFEGKGKE